LYYPKAGEPARNKDDFAHLSHVRRPCLHFQQKSLPQLEHVPAYSSPSSMILPQTSQSLVFLRTHTIEAISKR
jgi:hypothetical protein